MYSDWCCHGHRVFVAMETIICRQLYYYLLCQLTLVCMLLLFLIVIIIILKIMFHFSEIKFIAVTQTLRVLTNSIFSESFTRLIEHV